MKKISKILSTSTIGLALLLGGVACSNSGTSTSPPPSEEETIDELVDENGNDEIPADNGSVNDETTIGFLEVLEFEDIYETTSESTQPIGTIADGEYEIIELEEEWARINLKDNGYPERETWVKINEDTMNKEIFHR